MPDGLQNRREERQTDRNRNKEEVVYRGHSKLDAREVELAHPKPLPETPVRRVLTVAPRVLDHPVPTDHSQRMVLARRSEAAGRDPGPSRGSAIASSRAHARSSTRDEAKTGGRDARWRDRSPLPALAR